jgi:hypothetical protein
MLYQCGTVFYDGRWLTSRSVRELVKHTRAEAAGQADADTASPCGPPPLLSASVSLVRRSQPHS